MAGNQITEKYEYKTDIITSYDGHEQRIKTRQEPRRFLTYDYEAMTCYEAQWLRGMLRMRHTDAYYVPMWQAPIYLEYEFHKGSRELFVRRKDMFSLRDVEWVEIFVHDDANQGSVNLVRQVQGYHDGTKVGIITLKKSIPRNLNPKNTWIFGLKRCSIQPTNNISYRFANGTSSVQNFEDLLDKSPYVALPDIFISQDETYRSKNRWNLPRYADGYELLQIEPTWADDEAVTLGIDKAVNRLDNETGMFWYDLKNVKSYDLHTYQISLLNQEMIHNMIRFFKRVSGKWKSFFYPTWVNDIQILGDIESDSNYFLTDWTLMPQFYVNNKRKKKIVVFTKDWNSYIFDVLTYADFVLDNKKVSKIILQSNAGVDISKDNILMISYLNLVRFDSDELQLNYESNEVANTTLTVKEVDDL